MPCRKYSRAERGVTPPPGSPYFLPCRAPSSRPRRRSHSKPTPSGNPDVRGVQVSFQNQKEKHPQGVLFFLVAEVGSPPHGLAFSLRRKCCGRFGGSDTPPACHSLPPHPPGHSPFGLITPRSCARIHPTEKETGGTERCLPFLWLRRWDLNLTTSGL